MANAVYDPETEDQGTPAGKTPGRRGYDPQKTPKNDPSDPRGDLRDAENSGGLFNPGDEASANAADLKNSEETTGGLYNDDGSPRNSRGRRIVKKYGKRAAFGGGIAGLIITALVMFLSVVQGPLEFAHLAQLLEKFHFSGIQDAENGRLTNIIRYIRDPSKPERTRLGVVGNIAADRLETKMNEATGLRSEHNSLTGKFEGYSVIKDNPKFNGMTTDEIKQALVQTKNVDPSTIHVASDGKITFNPDPGGWNTIKRYRALTSFSRATLGEAGYSKISAHVGSRVLGKRAGWTFHPIKKLDATIQAQIVKGGKAALDKLKQQFNQQEATYEANGEATRPGGEPKAQQGQDAHGHPIDNPAADSEAQGARDLQSQAQNLDPTNNDTKTSFSDSMGVKVAGGGAAVIGIACVVRNISSSIDGMRQDKVMLPMMRKAGKIISLGSQVQSGQDIDMTSLGIIKSNWLDTQNKQGEVTSTWNDARSIQAENGKPLTGPDLPKDNQVFNKGNPFDMFDNVPALDTACGALESTFGKIFSIVTGPIAYVVTGEVLKQVIPMLADWLSGAPISPIASGADFGNIVNYGARLSANDQFASAGGVPLSSDQELAIKQTDLTLDRKDFQSKNIAYRLFNLHDSRTLASSLVDGANLSPVQNVSSFVGGLGHMFAAMFKVPAAMISGMAHATTSTYDYHGLRAVGFTASDLADPRFDNPFDNACHVVGCPNARPAIKGILEDPGKANTYIDRAQKCFGANITNNGGIWETNGLTQSVNFESKDYPESDCESRDLEWLRIRFWILDTAAMEGYACFQQIDDQSCRDLGVGTNTTDSSGAQTSASGLTNPFPDGWIPNRLDMGFDGSFKNKIVAPFSGTITYASTSFSNWGGYLEIKADQKPDGLPTSTLFFAEGIAPSVHAGQKVSAGDQIASPAPSPYGNAYGTTSDGSGQIEWGLAQEGTVGSPTDTYVYGQCGSADARQTVLSFYQWARQNFGLAETTNPSGAGCP